MPPLDSYTSATTAKNIVLSVEALAGDPELHLTPAGADPANATEIEACLPYRWLNEILRSLTMLHDWTHLVLKASLNISIGAEFVLPPNDFHRMANFDSLWIVQSNSRSQLKQLTREEFFANKQTEQGQPREFYVDRKSVTSFFLNPPANSAYVAELHYYSFPTRIISVSAVIAFPHTEYLEAALLVKYYLHQDDARAPAAEQMRQNMWRQIRATDKDVMDHSGFIPLDGNVFRSQPFEFE